MPNGLNEGHLRRLSSGMVIVDSAITRMLDLLNGHAASTPMTAIEGAPSNEEGELLRVSLQKLRVLISALAEKYDLEPSRKQIPRMLMADASQMWTSLEDCRPSRMRGYGGIPQIEAVTLESDLQRLLQTVNEIIQVLNP